ncbi:hypothetical protein [Paenibacillus lignilyticus]
MDRLNSQVPGTENLAHSRFSVSFYCFPGMQGEPLMHIIAGKAVCFGEELNPSLKVYAAMVLNSA